MRPAEFSQESIIKAGQELQAIGRNITGFALRQKVGGGNPTRLKQVWDEHVNSQTTAQAEPVAELPIEVAEVVATVTSALTERLMALAVDLNDKAIKAAERRVSEVVRAAGEQREQAERELADASQTVEDLENRLDEAVSAADVLKQQLADSQAVSQAQAVELAQVRERLVLTEQAATDKATHYTTELARLNALIEAERQRHQHETEQLRSELAKAQANAESAIKQIEIAQAEREYARQESAEAREEARGARKEAIEARQDAKEAREDVKEARKEAREAREEANEARREAQKAIQQAEDALRAHQTAV